MENTVDQQHNSFQFYFISFTHISKLHMRQADKKARPILSYPPGGFRTKQTVSFGGSCQHYQRIATGSFGSSLPYIWALQQQLLMGGESVSHSPPPSHIFPDGLGSQTGNLAVTNPPHKPSGHSCPPCWLVISSCGKLDASKHKVHSRCLKCHNITMQVVDWQRGRFRSTPLPTSLPHEENEAFFSFVGRLENHRGEERSLHLCTCPIYFLVYLPLLS